MEISIFKMGFIRWRTEKSVLLTRPLLVIPVKAAPKACLPLWGPLGKILKNCPIAKNKLDAQSSRTRHLAGLVISTKVGIQSR